MNTRMLAATPVLAVALLAVALLLGGCNNSATNTYNEIVGETPPDGLRTGEPTTVRLLPDAANAPIGQTVSGRLVSADATWIVLDEDGERRWLRLDRVVWIGQATPPPGADPAAPSEPVGSGEAGAGSASQPG